MSTVFILSIVMALAGCTGLVLAGKGMWQGWAIGLAVQPVWAVFAILTEGYGLLITCVMYGTVYGKNLLKWRKKLTTPTFAQVIVAGNYAQAHHYVESRGFDRDEVVIAGSAQSIEGLRFRRTDVHYVGTYYYRADLDEIANRIDRTTILYKE